jgi:hypothetical protein
VARRREAWLERELPADRHQEQPVAHLRDAVKRGVEQRVARQKAKHVELGCDFLRDVAAGHVQGVGNVLNQDRERRQLAHPSKPALVQAGTRVVQERLGCSRIVRSLARPMRAKD